MSPTPTSTPNRSSFPAQRLIAQVLIFLLVMQTVAPPTLAAPRRPNFSFTWLTNSASSFAGVLKNLSVSQPAPRLKLRSNLRLKTSPWC